MNLIEHSLRVWSRSITAKDRIEAGFVNNCVEGAVVELEASGVHLLVGHLGNLVFVVILHLLDNCKADVHVCNVLIAIFEHLLTKLGVTTTKH